MQPVPFARSRARQTKPSSNTCPINVYTPQVSSALSYNIVRTESHKTQALKMGHWGNSQPVSAHRSTRASWYFATHAHLSNSSANSSFMATSSSMFLLLRSPSEGHQPPCSSRVELWGGFLLFWFFPYTQAETKNRI